MELYAIRGDEPEPHRSSPLPRESSWSAAPSTLYEEYNAASQLAEPSPLSPSPNKPGLVSPLLAQPSPADKHLFSPVPLVHARMTEVTHDISLVKCCIPNQEWIERLDAAVQRAWPTHRRQQYDKVKVLMLTWQSADPELTNDVALIRSVFHDHFHYEVEEWGIPDQSPTLPLTLKIVGCAQASSSREELLIVYYTGHATDTRPGDPPIWFPRQTNDIRGGPHLEVASFHNLLCRTERNAPDVLLLYDSYYPAHTAECKQGHAVVELIAAYGKSDSPATRTAFPEILADVLTTAASGGIPISVPELYASLIQRFQDIADKIKGKSASDLGKRFSQLGGQDQPAYPSSQQPLPVHTPFGRDVTPRSIMLAPLRDKKSTLASGVPAATSTRVLLAVHIEESRYDEDAFKEWILRAPAAAKRIFISAVKPTYSTLLLVEMPVEVWTALEPSPAISFVGFLRGAGSGQLGETESAITATELTSTAPLFEKWTNSIASDLTIPEKRTLDELFDEIDGYVMTAVKNLKEPKNPSRLGEASELVTASVSETLDLKYGKMHFSRSEQNLIRAYVNAREFAFNPSIPHILRRRCAPLHAWLDEDMVPPDESRSFVSTSDSDASQVPPRSKLPSLVSQSDSGYAGSLPGPNYITNALPEPASNATASLRRQKRFYREHPGAAWKTYTQERSDPLVSTSQRESTTASGPTQEEQLEDLATAPDEDEDYLVALGMAQEYSSAIVSRQTYPAEVVDDEVPETATPRASTPTNFDIRGDQYGQIGDEENIDPRYCVEPATNFSPGKVFKVLWSEPQGATSGRGSALSAPFTDPEEREIYGQRFFVSFRRFIVVHNDEGHCVCVPILTYGGKGCTKAGSKPEKHGIIYQEGRRPHTLKNEPKLGFTPIAMQITASGEKLARESRVNYSKLMTIEHNVKVFMIGNIISQDFETVTRAVDKCWVSKARHRKKH